MRGRWGEGDEEEEEESDCCGRPEVVFLVKLNCTPQWGEEGEEVQMEECLVGDTGGGDGGWDIRGGSSRC